MKNLFQLIILISLTSCGIHSGLTSNSNVHNTTVQLSESNFKVIDYVSGSSSVSYFLGIGGLRKAALIESARNNMLRNSNLIGKPRAVINETVEIKRTTYIFMTEIKVTVSAYIIEFENDEVEQVQLNSEKSIQKENESINDQSKNKNNQDLFAKLITLNERYKSQNLKTVPYIENQPIIGDYVLFYTMETGPQIGRIYDIPCTKKKCICQVEKISKNGQVEILNVNYMDLIEFVQE